MPLQTMRLQISLQKSIFSHLHLISIYWVSFTFQIYVTWWVYIMKAILNHKVTPAQAPGGGGISLGVLWLHPLAAWCKELRWKRRWCWERLKAGEGDDRGWDGWMASPTQWTWVWASSGSWWWTGRPGVLRVTGSQRVEHDWLDWTVTLGCGGQGEVFIQIGVCEPNSAWSSLRPEAPRVSPPEPPGWPQQHWDPRRPDSLCRERSWQRLLDRPSELPRAQRVLHILCQPCRLGCASLSQTRSTKPSLWATRSPVCPPGEKKEKDSWYQGRTWHTDSRLGKLAAGTISGDAIWPKSEPSYGRCGKEGEIKYKAYVTFISFSFNLQVIELAIVRDKRQSSLEDWFTYK